MDYSAKLDQILYEISIVGSNTNVMKQELNDIDLKNQLIMEELQEIESGDNIRNQKIEKLNTSTTLIAITLITLLIYNFIVRSLK